MVNGQWSIFYYFELRSKIKYTSELKINRFILYFARLLLSLQSKRLNKW